MLAHAFSHDGAVYEVAFSRMDGQWFATVSRPKDTVSRTLPAFGDDSLGTFSDHAIRAGYIALAEWLVTSADWPNPDDLADVPQQTVRAPVEREKAAPCIDRPSQDLIGHELQALYADLLDEPVPDSLLSLLGAGIPSTDHPHRRSA